MDWPIVIAVLIASYFVFRYLKNERQNQQLAYIQKFHFNQAIKSKMLEKYPELTPEQMHKVFKALRDYFWMCNKAKRKMVAMPSQVVDDAWHEFILCTRDYKAFSKKAIGRFLHHTPTEAMKTPTLAQEGIKRAWRLACAKENINPRAPSKLPLIFAIDDLLGIKDGFKYSLNCKDKNSPAYGSGYCAGHIGCSSGCSGDSGSSSSDSGGLFDSSCSSGSDCGGGCGGD